MHRLWAWGSVALAAGLAPAVAAGDAADRPVGPDRGAAAFARWNGGPAEKPKPPAPLPATAQAKAKAQDTAAALRAQEEANFLRRMAVCDRLRQLALETGDDGLEKQAEDLQQKAESVYKQRTAVG